MLVRRHVMKFERLDMNAIMLQSDHYLLHIGMSVRVRWYEGEGPRSVDTRSSFKLVWLARLLPER